MIIGIDPGITGGMAYYDPALNYLRVDRLPVQWRLVNGKKRHEIDVKELFTRLKDCPVTIHTVICEEPHAMPGAGAASQFSFGSTCGAIRAALACLSTIRHIDRILYVDPSAWKTAIKCPSDKHRARALAQQYFPDYARQFDAASSDGMAEAALMAWYAANTADIKQKARTAVTRRARA